MICTMIDDATTTGRPAVGTKLPRGHAEADSAHWKAPGGRQANGTSREVMMPPLLLMLLMPLLIECSVDSAD